MDTAKISRMLGVTPHPKRPDFLQVKSYELQFTSRGTWIRYPNFRTLYETETALYRELFRLGLITSPVVDTMIESAEWVPDCQGKQDFDFNVFAVSTRYYPDFTAYASICLNLDKHGQSITLREKEFKSDCENATKQLVQIWIKSHLTELLTRLTAAGDHHV